MALTLADVLTVASVAEWEAKILSWATALGLPATSWQSGGVARTIIAVMANAMNASDQVSANIAAGGFLSTAAAITPEYGPGWLDSVAYYVYGVTRTPATSGTTTIQVTNAGAAVGPLAAGTYHVVVTSTGHTYSNSAAITLNPGSTTIALVCDQAGVIDTAASATLPVTTYPSVTTGALITAAVGATAETNASLQARCLDKLGALAPKLGNASSYRYFALTTTEPGYPLPSAPITRVNILADKYTGFVKCYIANASGGPSAGDVNLMQAYLDAVATPDAETLNVFPATSTPVNVVMQVWCAYAYSTQVVSDVTSALGTYFQALPIGGETLESGGLGVSFNALEDYVARQVPYIRTQNTTLNGLATSVALTSSQVATPGTITVTYMGA